ncbi:MAG: dihydroorotase [Bacteroidetes bacterium]|nr:MAG: dihydroorotase [Bacteroidota bacterium]
MSKGFVIKNATLVNEGKKYNAGVFVSNGIIEKIDKSNSFSLPDGYEVIDAGGLHLFPGVIDDQVHFRDPGLTYKADIYSESKAAVAGGVTSFMDMPNTVPNTITQEILEEKYRAASEKSLANFSFYMGANNNNLEEVVKTDPTKVCGIKVFMGSSTGNLLVDDETALENIFKYAPTLVATHCEDDATINANTKIFKEKYGDDAPTCIHPMIRSAEACYLSSSKAVKLAKKHNTRLHILHLSTAKEMALFDNSVPLEEKKITAEVCIHHLWFSDKDYDSKGNFIKWNPAVKSETDRKALFEALLDNTIDVVATDHAPHTLKEKEKPFFKAPSGGPMIQHSLQAMLEFAYRNEISVENVVEKMCHHPAILFKVKKRGFIREGYQADLVLVDLGTEQTVSKENILYKCGWSPMEGITFHSKIVSTFVNGHRVYNNGLFDETRKGERLLFER